MCCWKKPRRGRRNAEKLNTQLLFRVLKNQRILDSKAEAILNNQKEILMSNEAIQNEVNDLNAAVTVIGTGIGALTGNLDLALAKITELEAAGVDPVVVESLKAAVDGAQGIAAQFAAAVDPEQPTPPVEEIPTEPVETPEPQPETEAPVDPTAPQE